MTVRGFLYALAAIVSIEAGVRAIEAVAIKGSVGALTSFMVWDGDYWRLKPNSIIVQNEKTGDNEYRINSLGYRGAEIIQAKTTKRIVILGDPVIFEVPYMNDFGARPSDEPIDVGLANKFWAAYYSLLSKSAITRRLYQGVHMVWYALARLSPGRDEASVA